MPLQLLLLVLPLILSGPVSALAAQDASAPATRAEALRREREEKQKNLTPNEPDALQRAMNYVEDRALFLVQRDGFHPKLGSLTTGSGFAFGVGFRDRDLFARHGRLELWTAASFKKYWAMQGRVRFPDLLDRGFFIEGVGDLREYPRELFFGLGPDSRRQDETEYSLRMSDVSGRAGLRVLPKTMAGGGIGLLSTRVDAGKTDFVRSLGFVEVDYRQPINARRGGWYRLDVSRYNDRDGAGASFYRTDLDLRQYIGFLADRRVIALRGWLSTTEPTNEGSGVPFYLMPSLGGNDSLRGFRAYRFRGPHALLLQAEYRWELWSGLDAALFYDAGKVTMQRSDLNFRKLQDDYGFGFRFNTSNGVVMRVDAAFGSPDGKHLHIVFGGVF